jgi:hypothetical protein
MKKQKVYLIFVKYFSRNVKINIYENTMVDLLSYVNVVDFHCFSNK